MVMKIGAYFINEKTIELFISKIIDDVGARSGDEKPCRMLSRTKDEKPNVINQYSIRIIKNKDVMMKYKNPVWWLLPSWLIWQAIMYKTVIDIKIINVTNDVIECVKIRAIKNMKIKIKLILFFSSKKCDLNNNDTNIGIKIIPNDWGMII